LSVADDKVGQLLFDLGQANEAVTSFSAAIQIGKPPDTSEFYWRRAVAKLYANDSAGVADDAAMALKLKPSDSYYPIWLHVARARAGQNDADEIAANAEKIDRSWPWPIAALFLGSMSPADVRSAALSADQERTHAAQSCEADFFVGFYLTEKGAKTGARPLFQSAVDHCPNDFIEYGAAKFELMRLDDVHHVEAR
jgi:lipoprotein NlpI